MLCVVVLIVVVLVLVRLFLLLLEPTYKPTAMKNIPAMEKPLQARRNGKTIASHVVHACIDVCMATVVDTRSAFVVVRVMATLAMVGTRLKTHWQLGAHNRSSHTLSIIDS